MLARYVSPSTPTVDPFARNTKWGTITNDLNPDTSADYHLDCCDFLGMMIAEGRCFRAGLLDPPYSSRQVMECYQGFGKSVTQRDTQMGWMKDCKDRLDRLIAPGGIVISFGWNSVGMGIGRGYEIIEIMLVCHGGQHHDTLVTVERRRLTESQ